MANFLPPAVIEIKAVADKAIAELKKVNGELDKMDKNATQAGGGISKMEKASKLATGALIGMGAAFAGFAAIGIKEATEAESIMNRLGATMSAAGFNTKKARDQVTALSESFVQLGFDDEAAASGMEILIRMTGDMEKSQKLLALSADLARAKNIDLTTAAQMLARASNGSTRVFREMGITLDTTLPKAEAIDKAMKQLNDRIGNQAENATKTYTVQLQIMKEQFNNTAQALGTALLPILKTMLEYINRGIEFVKKHSAAFKLIAGVIITVTVALAAYNAAIKVQMALTKAWTVITTVQKTVTALLTGQQLALNTAMKLNPIGLVVTAATLLIGAFVMLWNKSETFRKGVIAVGKAGLNAFAAIIPMLGKVGEAYLKFLLTPMKLFLTALSKLPGVGKYAKAGLDLLTKGLDGVSDFADKASAKAKQLAANLDKLNKPVKINIGGDGGIPDFGNGLGTGKGKGKGKGIDPKEKAALEKKNADYLKIVQDLNNKVIDAQNKYNDAIAKAQKIYDDKTAAARARAAEIELKAYAKHAEDMLKAQQKRDEAIFKAEQDARKKRQAVQDTFNETMARLNAKRAEDLAKLQKDNAAKVQAIYKANAEKLQSIVQQSIDRLRDAYKKGTEFSVTDVFKGLVDAGKRTADDLLAALRVKLDGARVLAEKASQLAGLGFSQTFIEQVVSAGPEVGTQLADSILNATPDTIKELQATFKAMETQTNTGLNKLATAMNKGGTLATEELNKAYADAQKELTDFLAEQARDYMEAQAQINREFNEQMAEAERTRDTALAAIEADLADTLAEIEKNFNESVAEIDKALNDSLAENNKELNDALAEAAKDLAEATEEARKNLADTLADIAAEFDEKLGQIKDGIASTMAAIAQLQAAIAGAQAAAAQAMTAPVPTTPQPLITPLYPTGVPPTFDVAAWRAGEQASMAGINITQNFTTDYVDPIQVKTQMLNAIYYGSTVQVTPVLTGGGGGPNAQFGNKIA